MAPSIMTAYVTGHRSILGRMYNAVTRYEIGHGADIGQVTTPAISEIEVLVKVNTVAQNPTDYKHIDLLSPANSIIGCDFAGTVEALGSKALGGWQVGDRIAGVVHGGLYPDKGSYAQYLKVEGDLAWKIPNETSDHNAATYGVSATTAMLGLYLELGIPWPDETPADTDPTLLVYAGSTGASLFAIQMARKAGYQVVTTCSPHSFDLVKGYGANAVYDYHDADALAQIKAAFPNIMGAFDGISAGSSTKFCCEAVGSTGGKIISLLPGGKSNVVGVEVKPILAYTLFGKPFGFFQPLGPKWPAVPEDRAGLVRFYKMLPRLVEDGVLKAPPVRVIEGGFEGLRKGMDLLKEGKVSGQKLVVDLQ